MTHRIHALTAFLLLTFIATPSLAAEDPASLHLIPFPKEVSLQPGSFSLARPISLNVIGTPSDIFADLIGAELRRAKLNAPDQPDIKTQSSRVFCIRLFTRSLQQPPPPKFRDNPSPEDYSLQITPDTVTIHAIDRPGLLNGLQTLCQLIRANRTNNSIPCLTINDYPSLRWRCFQDDLTRGPSSKLDTLKHEITTGAYFKLNLFTYYMEYQFAFKKHPLIGPKDGSLEPDDLKSLVEYARPLGIDILGNQQSFGHFGRILQHPQYAPLRENADVLTPVKDETYQLLDDLYSEICPLVPFPFFNVCCDETYGLGTGPSKDLAQKIGVGAVYAQHLVRIHDLLKTKYNKRMMMWGDIILQHPANLKDIPKDTIMLTWGYDPRPSFEDQIIPFAKSGYKFFVCPGVSNWSRILPDFAVANTNIQNFVRDGVKHGAIGMLNTSWEDDGEALKGIIWHAHAWAAECAWNASKTDPAAFNRRIGTVLFGEKSDHFGQAITLLSKTHTLPDMKGMNNARFWQNDFVLRANPESIQTSAGALLKLVRPAIMHLELCRLDATLNQHLVDTYLHGARRMELIAQRMLDGLDAATAYQQAPKSPKEDALKLLDKTIALIHRTRDAHAALGRQFSELWLNESKPYALDWTTRRYQQTVRRYDELEEKVADARKQLESGKPLPAPEDIGLTAPTTNNQ
ncbi:MAG: family 20 glycosylhydrolase [Planctomycetota bacterium]|nr:family 20 glycosylhydrolase [Planctomycetota bacterium]